MDEAHKIDRANTADYLKHSFLLWRDIVEDDYSLLSNFEGDNLAFDLALNFLTLGKR